MKTDPQIVISSSVGPVLTARVQEALDRLLWLVGHEAKRNLTPVSKIEVNCFVDPEEDTEELVVTQWVKMSAQAALDHWDKLGSAVEVWTDSLPEELKRIVIDKLAIEVRWDIIDDTTP